MGWFDALFGGGKKRTNLEVVPDHLWMTTSAKFAGLAKDAKDRANFDTVAILLVAHFPDVLAQLEAICQQSTWRVPCMAVLASQMNPELAAQLSVDETATIDIIVGERHPLPSVDDRLEAFAGELPCRCRLSHHVSLDDAVMKVFAGDWVKSVLRQLGMKDDEAIESPMVSRRLRRAQQKIEGRGLSVQEADSAAQWLEMNCPDLISK